MNPLFITRSRKRVSGTNPSETFLKREVFPFSIDTQRRVRKGNLPMKNDVWIKGGKEKRFLSFGIGTSRSDRTRRRFGSSPDGTSGGWKGKVANVRRRRLVFSPFEARWYETSEDLSLAPEKMSNKKRESADDSQLLASKESSLFRQLVRFYESKQYRKAIKSADQILKKKPNHGETLSMKGLSVSHMGRKEESYALAREGLKRDLKSHVCWHVYGYV